MGLGRGEGATRDSHWVKLSEEEEKSFSSAVLIDPGASITRRGSERTGGKLVLSEKKVPLAGDRGSVEHGTYIEY